MQVSPEKLVISLIRLNRSVHIFIFPEQSGKPDPGINGDADPGYVLGDDRRLSGAGNAPSESGDKPEVKDNVEYGGDREEDQRYHRIPQRAKERGKKIIEENADQPCKDHDQIFFHQFHQLAGRAEKPDDPVDSGEDQDIEHYCHNPKERERSKDPFFQPLIILLAEADGEDRAAPHGEPQDNGSQKGHQGRRRILPAASASAPRNRPDDQGICNIVALLKKITQDHRDSKTKHGLHDRSAGQLIFHFYHIFLFVILNLTFVIYDKLRENDCQTGRKQSIMSDNSLAVRDWKG